MKKSKKHFLFNAWIMFKRCLKISLRNPETIIMATLTPFFLMLLFGTVFGSIANIENFNYIDFIVPGIILQSIAQASQYTGMNITSDMTKGIIDRFRCMSISKSAVLIGHTGAGVMRGVITTTIIILTAILLGFRPQAGIVDWLLVIGLLLLVNITITFIAVLCGMVSKSIEGSGGLLFPLFILPFVSSGFAPVDTMPSGIRWFAEVQPMTPIVDSLRSLTLDLPLGNSLWLALAWCVGICIVCYIFSLRIYNRRSS